MKQLGFDLILLGDTASGKDTQAAILQKKYKLKAVESGKFWRQVGQRKRQSKLIRDRQRLSLPAPAELIKEFIRDSIQKTSQKQDLIFVGAARLKPEAQYLVKLLKQKRRQFFVLYIKLPSRFIIQRSLLRAQRAEDKDIKRIKTRIKYYKDQVSKTVQYYSDMKKLKFINGNQSIPKVAKDIQKAIDDYQRSQRN